MIDLLLHHPLMFLGGLGVAWLLFLVPGAGAFLTLALKRVLGVLQALVKTERGRAVLWLALVAGLVWWFRTFAGPAAFAAGRASFKAEVDAHNAKVVAAQLTQALQRDDTSSEASSAARQSTANRSASLNDRRQTAEGIARERPLVPAVCPEPDPRLVRLDAEERARLSGAESRLRDLRQPANGAARGAGGDKQKHP